MKYPAKSFLALAALFTVLIAQAAPASAYRRTPNPGDDYPSWVSAYTRDLRFGETQYGVIRDIKQSVRWQFTGKAGDIISIIVDSGFDSYLEVKSPSGEIIAFNDDASADLDAAIYSLEIERGGVYDVLISSVEGLGEYSLVMYQDNADPVFAGVLSLNREVTAAITGQGTSWSFAGNRGEHITITAKALDDEVDTYIEFYNPDGTLLAEDDDSAAGLNAEIFEVLLEETGQYSVVVSNLGHGIGTVSILATSGLHPTGGSIYIDQTVFSDLRGGRPHEWYFDAKANDIIEINLTSDYFDPTLKLLNPAGEIIAENDDAGFDTTDSLIRGTLLPVQGIYTIVAGEYSEEAGGPYRLILQRVNEEYIPSEDDYVDTDPFEGFDFDGIDMGDFDDLVSGLIEIEGFLSELSIETGVSQDQIGELLGEFFIEFLLGDDFRQSFRDYVLNNK